MRATFSIGGNPKSVASGNLINIIEGSVASKHEGRIVLQHPTSKRNIYIKEIMREMWNRQGTGGGSGNAEPSHNQNHIVQIAVLRSGLVSRTTHKFQAFTVFRTLYTDSQLGFLVPLYTLLSTPLYTSPQLVIWDLMIMNRRTSRRLVSAHLSGRCLRRCLAGCPSNG